MALVVRGVAETVVAQRGGLGIDAVEPAGRVREWWVPHALSGSAFNRLTSAGSLLLMLSGSDFFGMLQTLHDSERRGIKP